MEKKNPNIKLYMWNNKAYISMSCIDYWLVSHCSDRNNIIANIITTPLDNRAVSLQVSFRSDSIYIFRGSYWKLNNTILKHD